MLRLSSDAGESRVWSPEVEEINAAASRGFVRIDDSGRDAS